MKLPLCVERIVDLVGDSPCVVSVAHTWDEWHRVRPSDGNLMLKTLGLGSSIALGLALTLPKHRIFILDGDGAALMNLNGIVTVGWMQPKNLVHIVFDNNGYDACGGTPSATSAYASLDQIARGAGIASSCEVREIEPFVAAVQRANTTDGPHFICAKVERTEKMAKHTRYDEMENRYLFIRYLEKLENRKLLEYAMDVASQ